MRQRSKQILTLVKQLIRSAAVAVAATALSMFAGAAFAQDTPTTERLEPYFVPNPLTGVALDGFDPVSYFIESSPQLGNPTYEYFYGGVSWYFVSKANLDTFKRNPDIYVPQFGGFGTLAVARGFRSIGDPLIYLVVDSQLFLFYSLGNRQAFELTPNTARLKAIENWREMLPTLPR